jgi:hypothetical protein
MTGAQSQEHPHEMADELGTYIRFSWPAARRKRH